MGLLDLFKPKWQHSAKHVREAAVMQLNDQTVLAQIAKNDADEDVRSAAVMQLEDQAALAHAATSDTEASVRKAAVERLTDQAALAQVATNDADPNVHRAAVGRLSDPTALAQIAKTDTEAFLRKIAVGRLTDQAALAHVAKTDTDLSLRQAAVERLMDQEALAHVAKTDTESSVRRAAVESRYAPRSLVMFVNPDRIRDIIGPGGKVIRAIQDETGTKIEVDDSGKVLIASVDMDGAEQAKKEIQSLTREAEVGKIYQGIVRKVTDFGAFVEIFPGTDGLVHISQLAPERVRRVTDVAREGDTFPVKVIGIDSQGKSFIVHLYF